MPLREELTLGILYFSCFVSPSSFSPPLPSTLLFLALLALISSFLLLNPSLPQCAVHMIDLGQAVDVHHPRARDLLARDLGNLQRFFRDRRRVALAGEHTLSALLRFVTDPSVGPSANLGAEPSTVHSACASSPVNDDDRTLEAIAPAPTRPEAPAAAAPAPAAPTEALSAVAIAATAAGAAAAVAEEDWTSALRRPLESPQGPRGFDSGGAYRCGAGHEEEVAAALGRIVAGLGDR